MYVLCVLCARARVVSTQVFNALVGYLRTAVPPASAAVKPRVVMLLSQLLQSPHMFVKDDLPDVSKY